MAQEPFGDAHQQPWHPQPQQAWTGGGYQQPPQAAPFGQPLSGEAASGQPQFGQSPSGSQEYWPQEQWQQEQWPTSAGYGQVPQYGEQPAHLDQALPYDQASRYGGAQQDDRTHQYDQAQWYQQTAPYADPAPYGAGPHHGDAGYGATGYVQGGHLQDRFQPHQAYPDPDPGQQPAGEGLYVPAGAEYSADGYVHLDEAEPETGPAAADPADRDREPTPEPAAVAPPRAAGRRGGAAAPAGSSLGARARAAAGTVLSGEHVPSRRALLVRTGAGVAALGVLVAAALTVGAEGGGTAAADSGGEPGFAVAHTRTWSAQPAAAAGPTGTDDTLVGSWLLADAVVRADAAGVRAYDLAAGKPVWSVEPPAAGAVPCGLSAGVNKEGLGAVLFRPQADPKSPCTLVAAVDTKTGRTAWTKSVSDAKGAYVARIGVTEDKVIAVGDDRAIAWESADGKDVWQYTGQGKFCTLSGGVSGKTVLIASSCADSTPADQAVALNTADGKVGWWRGLNNRPKTVTVLSAEPPVVLTTGGKPEDDRVFAWGAGGDPAAEIPVVGDGGRLDLTHGTFSATPDVFFQDRTMVTTLVQPNGGGPVVAVGYDLDTGKQRWKSPTAAKGTVRAVGLDGGSLVLAADERRDQPAHLNRFPLAGGQEATGGNFPPGTGSLLVSGRVLIGGGRVAVVPEHSANFGTAAVYQAKG
ncbi:PQQ-binding-like beta-propeller repeat protein [Kitasatospora sp. NPDC048538]|uniref:outer membrane protein assembly factor BamB family protein n=1 Tax=unclassified Kitasatospora TaxID=2633591 RepID=UPI0033F09137